MKILCPCQLDEQIFAAPTGFEPAFSDDQNSMAVNALPYYFNSVHPQILPIEMRDRNGNIHTLRGFVTFTTAFPFKLRGASSLLQKLPGLQNCSPGKFKLIG